MSTQPEPLSSKPRAHAQKVEELVADAMRGRVRVPRFQRALKWEAEDVRHLFDSIYRGYPVGNLLFWSRSEVDDAPVQLGPIQIDNPDDSNVRWVVDGQQRITSLTCALSEKGAEDPRFQIWFDPDGPTFHTSPKEGPDPQWVEVWRLLDAADLGEFLFTWTPGKDRPDRRKALLEAGKRIREYPLPSYTIETDSEPVLREVFRRSNRSGKALGESDVFNALVGGPETGLDAVHNALIHQGWGALTDSTLLQAVKAILGEDPTRSLDQAVSDEREARYQKAIATAKRAVTSAVRFLHMEAQIPHRRLLPYRAPLVVLPKFFSQFPEPSPRSRRQLVRWVWRGFLSGVHQDVEKVRLRAALGAIRDDEEASVTRLLDLVPTSAPEWRASRENSFDARAAIHRIGLLGLAHLAPRIIAGPSVGDRIDVRALLESEGAKAMRRLFPNKVVGTEEQFHNISNRVLHPKASKLRSQFRKRARDLGIDDAVLKSHAIDSAAAQALLEDDFGAFLTGRLKTIEHVVNARASAMAEWGHPARRTLSRLLESEAS